MVMPFPPTGIPQTPPVSFGPPAPPADPGFPQGPAPFPGMAGMNGGLPPQGQPQPFSQSLDAGFAPQFPQAPGASPNPMPFQNPMQGLSPQPFAPQSPMFGCAQKLDTNA